MMECFKIIVRKLSSADFLKQAAVVIETMDDENMINCVMAKLDGRLRVVRGDDDVKDSAPSDTDDDTEDLVGGNFKKKLEFDNLEGMEGTINKGKPDTNFLSLAPKNLETKTIGANEVSSSARKTPVTPARRTRENRSKAREKLKITRKAEGEKNAAKEMSEGDDIINLNYEELIFKLVGVGPSQLASSLKGKSDSKYSKNGVVIVGERGKTFKLGDLISSAEKEGGKLIDTKTGELLKKMPCGFFPACDRYFGISSIVGGGTLTQPTDHRRHGKMVYVCLEHKETEDVGVSGDDDTAKTDLKDEQEASATDGEVLDELETSVADEEDGQVLSQSLLRRV